MDYAIIGTLFAWNIIFIIQTASLVIANKSLKKRVKALERENAELKRSFDELFVKRRK